MSISGLVFTGAYCGAGKHPTNRSGVTSPAGQDVLDEQRVVETNQRERFSDLQIERGVPRTAT